MTIVTQENELINYNAIKRIAIFTANVEDETSSQDEDMIVYTIVAFDLNSDTGDEVVDGAIQLGVFDTENECLTALQMLISSIEKGVNIFQMPTPQWSEV